ncbi:LytTR family two component transcriptional regulator [Chitinophaga niastensis]|uniref:LytTR family two component transcriptional regulator n=1 Tax=Chitinophaga niastensis TaxID=536980 RepID=A0A2P8HEL2_CHINA|nr:LytTR family DNA-binding domain-containing protein [Chitinophaga niastensis]PSL44660.1 LytTR family two component transcriptional regulator [Chitinophaga niastensis]
MINCYIIDDEQHSIDLLEKYVTQTPFLKLAGSSTNALEALKAISAGNIKLIFLDIHMPEISGIDLLKIVGGTSRVILTTAYSEYAFDGFELDVIDYLLKPITQQRFLKATQKALIYFQSTETEAIEPPALNYIFVKAEHKGKQIKINFEDVEYVEGIKNYVAFHCHKEKVLALMNMKDLENTLPKNNFARIHNSFIISLNRITSVEGNQVILRKRDNTTVNIPIGITFKTAFFDLINLRK